MVQPLVISIRRGFVKTLIGKLSDEEVRMLVLEIATTSNRDFLLILKNKVSILLLTLLILGSELLVLYIDASQTQ